MNGTTGVEGSADSTMRKPHLLFGLLTPDVTRVHCSRFLYIFPPRPLLAVCRGLFIYSGISGGICHRREC